MWTAGRRRGREFPIVSRVSICKGLSFNNFVSNLDHRSLINGCILIASLKFRECIALHSAIEVANFFLLASVVTDTNLRTAYIDDLTIAFSCDNRT